MKTTEKIVKIQSKFEKNLSRKLFGEFKNQKPKQWRDEFGSVVNYDARYFMDYGVNQKQMKKDFQDLAKIGEVVYIKAAGNTVPQQCIKAYGLLITTNCERINDFDSSRTKSYRLEFKNDSCLRTDNLYYEKMEITENDFKIEKDRALIRAATLLSAIDGMLASANVAVKARKVVLATAKQVL